MATQRRLRFVRAQTAWMIVVVILLTLLNALSLELFFVTSLIGLLIVTELTAPSAVTPHWRVRLRWLVLLGLIGFGYIVLRRILSILPSAVMP